mmetsp:Transcript_77043/g.127090  ORF Transcript_77043/g.127090 Transcript_77043/m.127090 type:complete len:280 (-) Transcript_77043:454-1293(-)
MLEDTILPCAINAELAGRVLHPLTEQAHFAVVRVASFAAIAFAAFVNDVEEAEVGNVDSAFASSSSSAGSAHLTAATSPAVATPRSRPVISVAILLAAAARRTPSPAIALAAAVGLATVTVAAVAAVIAPAPIALIAAIAIWPVALLTITTCCWSFPRRLRLSATLLATAILATLPATDATAIAVVVAQVGPISVALGTIWHLAQRHISSEVCQLQHDQRRGVVRGCQMDVQSLQHIFLVGLGGQDLRELVSCSLIKLELVLQHLHSRIFLFAHSKSPV